jgi:phytoene desaturase
LGKKVIVIGSGFAGLSAASFMAKAGWEVTVLEKLSGPGGRARQLISAGFTFDMGPSWYWMPDVFERYFAQFGKKVSDYYKLQRLDPSYRAVWDDGFTDIPANLEELKSLFESLEPGAADQLTVFLKEAEYKYRVGINKLVHKPGRSVSEFIDLDLIKGVFKLDVFTSMKKHIHRYFKHPRIRMLLEFPVLFLGALAEDTPALYSLMNYADMVGGTWYPEGGMFSVVNAMHQLAVELGVEFKFGEAVTDICVHNSYASTVETLTGSYRADVVIAGADYHHVETKLLSQSHRSYPESYWNSRHMAPSCLIYFVGLNMKLQGAGHHTLFFDVPFDVHAKQIYSAPAWPSEPLFYVSVPSVTDQSVAPMGHENLFFLIPVAAGLTADTQELRDRYFEQVIQRYEAHIGQSIKNSIVYKKSFAYSDFVNDYNSFRGNAYGLANTLMQTAILKPACRSKKVRNLYFTGQLTVPGPGVPPSLISGEVVSKEVLKNF